MTLLELQKEVGELSEDQQDTLATYLTMLRRSRDPEWEDTLSRRIQEKNPDQWVDLDDIESEF